MQRGGEHLKDSLLTHWEAIPPDVRTQALNGGWYRESRRVARALGRKHDRTLATSAGIIAALSPRLHWSTNVYAAGLVLQGYSEGVPGYPRNVEKAVRIWEGERPLDVLGGPKVTAFYRAIMGDKSAAVIDVWMWRAMGIPVAAVPYEEAAQALRCAAEEVGVSVSLFQALVWHQLRGEVKSDEQVVV